MFSLELDTWTSPSMVFPIVVGADRNNRRADIGRHGMMDVPVVLNHVGLGPTRSSMGYPADGWAANSTAFDPDQRNSGKGVLVIDSCTQHDDLLRRASCFKASFFSPTHPTRFRLTRLDVKIWFRRVARFAICFLHPYRLHLRRLCQRRDGSRLQRRRGSGLLVVSIQFYAL
ncbi:hypothetical protein BD779DRAFT_1499265 [Infundibulicybe gibba]|nr:hypothetical protein BD779DRAFT_1499265 [Infundibulicybe gibba]